jgi:hypothetical protein
MAVFLSPVGGVAAQFFTNTGDVLSGGKLYTYLAGTSTPAATYTSASGTTFNTNPIVLDSAGRVPSSGEIWLGEGVQYKFVLKDSNDVLIASYDNITGINSNFVNYNALEEIQVATAGQTVFNLTNSYQPGTNTLSVFVDGVNQYDGSSYSYTETSSTRVTFVSGLHVGALVKFTTAVTLSAGVVSSNLVTYQPAGTGAVQTTVQTKLRQTVSVQDFGAVGDGSTDDTAAIQAAITYAFSTGVKVEVSGNKGVFKVSAPIVYPAGSLVTLRNMKLVAASSFDVTRYMIEVTSQSAGLCNANLSFEDLYIDANHRGGCLRIDNYIRVTVFNCTFVHFSTCGLRLDGTLDSHECLVSKVWAFEYLYGESGYLTPTATSVGLQINSFDNEINQYVSYYTGYGLVVNAQYNLISQAHVGGGTYAMRITQNAAWTSIAQSYVDSASVLWENPWNSEITGTKFLINTSNATFAFIVLKPLAANTYMYGVKVTQCSFSNNGAATVISVKNDTSAGTFDYANLRNNYIENNSFNKATEAYTRLRTSFFQSSATVWTFNLANYMPVGAVQKVTNAYYCNTAATFPVSIITSVSGTTVIVTNSIASNGTMFIDADVNVSYS